jgi:hypothetical protein
VATLRSNQLAWRVLTEPVSMNTRLPGSPSVAAAPVPAPDFDVLTW